MDRNDELLALRAENTRLKEENKQQKEIIAELKRQLASEEQINTLFARELDEFKKKL